MEHRRRRQLTGALLTLSARKRGEQKGLRDWLAHISRRYSSVWDKSVEFFAAFKRKMSNSTFVRRCGLRDSNSDILLTAQKILCDLFSKLWKYWLRIRASQSLHGYGGDSSFSNFFDIVRRSLKFQRNPRSPSQGKLREG